MLPPLNSLRAHRMRTLSIGLLAVLLAFPFLSPRAGQSASPYQPAPLPEQISRLTAEADLIVRGRVIAGTSGWNEDHSAIVTRNTVRVAYVVAGDQFNGSQNEIVVYTLGGELPAEGIGLGVPHAAHLETGDEVLLFLRADSERPGFTVVAGEEGVLTIVGDQVTNDAWPGGRALPSLMDQIIQAATVTAMPVHLPGDWPTREAVQQVTRTAEPLSAHAPNTFVDVGIHWPGNAPTVGYVVNINTGQADQGNGSAGDFLRAVLQAAQTWNDVGSADFTFEYRGETGITELGDANGLNDVIFSSAGRNGTLGQTRFWYDPDAHTVLETDIWFNDSYAWDATGAPTGDEIDLQSVALHEFGHWFVLGHDSDAAAVMYYSMSSGQTKRALYSSDIDGITSIYPCENQPCNGEVPPTATLTVTPVAIPTEMPTEIPTVTPTFTPTETPIDAPTVEPTAAITATMEPPGSTITPAATITPTVVPTTTPGIDPTEPPPAPTAGATETVTPTPEPPAEQAEIRPDEESTVHFGNDAERPALEIDVPAGAVDQPTTLGYTSLPSPPVGSDAGIYAGVRFRLSARQDDDWTNDLHFDAPLRFTLAYPEPEGNIDETDLTLYRLESSDGSWQRAACGDEAVAGTDNQVISEVCNNGEFALFFSAAEDASDGVFLPLIRR
ncbi:MAG: matrixin family metalloprotease [Caldilineaceae bacterium]|nr:matrixin family metalloprotease [Caldilineaceae bacterium]